MAATYRKIHLGHEAIQYIKDYLANGKTLSSLLLQTCNLDNGKVVTYLPSFLKDEAIKQFRFGGKIEQDVVLKGMTLETDLWLFAEIHTFLTARNNRVCIFEHALARPNDEWLSIKRPQILTYMGEVYLFLLGADAQNEKIKQTVRNATAYLFIGVMASLPHETRPLEPGQEVTYENLRTFAERTEKIIVGAYDGEGYLIWSKYGV